MAFIRYVSETELPASERVADRDYLKMQGTARESHDALLAALRTDPSRAPAGAGMTTFSGRHYDTAMSHRKLLG